MTLKTNIALNTTDQGAKMKKVLGLIGSPRKSGNCETMIKEVSRRIPEAHELILIRLPAFNIRACTGCYNCLFKESCHIKDDLYIVLDQIRQADAFIVSAPAYVFGANASLKLLLDRALAFHRYGSEIWKKPAVAIGLAGIKGKEGRTLLDLEGFLMGMGMTRQKTGMVYGALPGEALLNAENLELAEEFAKALFSDEPEQRDGGCPLCGGQTFRFTGGTSVQCMLCSHTGTVSMEEGTPVFHMTAEDDIALTREAVAGHGEWLMGMKKGFRGSREELKKVRQEYQDDGTWVKPLAS